MAKKEIKSGISFIEDKEGHGFIQIVCGGKIGFSMGTNFEEGWTGVDLDELVESVGVGECCTDSPIRQDTPTIRVVANNPDSYLVIIKAFAKAYLVQKAMNENPDIEYEEFIKMIEGNYELLVQDIEVKFLKKD